MADSPSATLSATDPVVQVTREGLAGNPKTLPPWLFYDERGSELFEQITELPEYYLTRTERALLERYADEILRSRPAARTIVELGAGTAKKTGVLLAACLRRQHEVLYQPIDISPSALEAACTTLAQSLPCLSVRPQVRNYITEPYQLEREPFHAVMALYIGSSIGNFAPAEARGILGSLRGQLLPGDQLLLGTDLAPSAGKAVAELLAAYDDAEGVTAAFNRNMLVRLNRELGADFDIDLFSHEARWNQQQSRIEMHLVSLVPQTVQVAGQSVRFAKGESIHTENSYKFTAASLHELLQSAGFRIEQTFHDPAELYGLTLAEAV